jgi:hypothetical protein
VERLIAYPQRGAMTQGTIFSCAVAEDYRACTTRGLIITARCDVANDKVRTYNYLPVVPFSDWIWPAPRKLPRNEVESVA